MNQGPEHHRRLTYVHQGKGETTMKKIITAAVIAGTLALSSAAPAQAARDGEVGYAIGCLILWHGFGMWDLCQELQ